MYKLTPHLPNHTNLLQNLYTGVLWVDNELIIRWVNPQTEQLLSVSQSRLCGLDILSVFSPTSLRENPTLNSKSQNAISPSSTTVENNKPKTSTVITQLANHQDTPNANSELTQLAIQFINAKDYQQPFIEYDRHIIGVVHPLYVDYSVTPVKQNDETYFVIEFWEKNRQSRIDKEHRLLEQHEVAREMLRSVAHEVKNPLAGIRGAAQLLIKQTQRAQTSKTVMNQPLLTGSTHDEDELDYNMMLVDAKKLSTYADIVITETDRLTDLIGQLLGSNKLPEWELLNIHEPLEHVLILTQTQHPKIKIVRDYDLSLPELKADKNQLIQVFLNLANNACEAMIEHAAAAVDENYEPTLRVKTRIEYRYTIGSVYHRQVLMVCINDNGGGIDPDIIERIFFPLVTGRANGTGLGLALVQEMVHRHCGAIEVSSSPNDTAFCIYLPFSLDIEN